jgi:hypothetical protein
MGRKIYMCQGARITNEKWNSSKALEIFIKRSIKETNERFLNLLGTS